MKFRGMQIAPKGSDVAFLQGKYERVSYDPEKEKELRERLTILFSEREGGSLSPDGIQLSQSIAAGANCFITQDRALLKRAKQVNSEFGLSILSPAELTCRVDEVHQRNPVPTGFVGRQ